MNDIFGIPTAGITSGLLLVLSLCLLAVAWVAWRRPVIFKLGVRNIPRRKAQTTLIVLGLMLSTLIIAAALGTGDTLDYSATADVYRQLGHVDEAVVRSQDVNASVNSAIGQKIDDRALARVEQTVAGDPNVDGVMPILDERVPVLNPGKQLAEPTAILTGLDPSRLDQFGGLIATDGSKIDLAALPADQIVVSAKAADKLDAVPGDKLTIYYGNQPRTFTVAKIARDSTLAGQRETAISLVLPLDRLQRLTNQPDTLTLVAVSNKGGVRDSAGATDAVVAKLRGALAGSGLGVDAVKQRTVKQSGDLASVFTGLFLVLGLFSIAAGVLLIVLIFTMLAAERRAEMGMARAVGTQRRQLIQQFVSEGAGYALLSGLVGAALGIAAAIGIAFGMRALFGQYLPIEPHVTPRSMVAAYSLGVVITFLAVVGSSWKISRLNVVAAVRDIPDVMIFRRKKIVMFWGVVLTLVGAVMILTGHNSESAFLFYGGMSLFPFGLVLILRFFGLQNRIILTVVGLYIVTFWLLPFHIVDSIFGKTNGGFEMFFLSGIFMVIGATIVIVQNLDVLLAGVSRLGGFFQSKLPAVRTAISYPGAAKGRTGMTIAMFSLIVFSLVMVATMNQNYASIFLSQDASAGWNVRADALGANPVGNLTQALQAKGVKTGDFTAVGAVTSPGLGEMRIAGTQDWKRYTVGGMDAGFIAHSKLNFGQRATGYATDADIIKALQTQPNVAIVDANALQSSGGFGGGGGDQFQLTGVKSGDKTFAPVKVELAKPDGGVTTVTVIGVLDTKISTLIGLYAPQATVAATYPRLASTSYYIALSNAGQSQQVAHDVEKALLANGVQAVSIRKELQDAQRQNSGFLYLIEGFMALGLFVGVAAVGVIAFRSVVERRQQIGMLRAIGYQRAMVSLSFLIETGFVVALGVISGTALGLVLARNLFRSDSSNTIAGSPFLIPWGLISLILGATVVVALIMTWIPARQAASVAPAEALRYE